MTVDVPASKLHHIIFRYPFTTTPSITFSSSFQKSNIKVKQKLSYLIRESLLKIQKHRDQSVHIMISQRKIWFKKRRLIHLIALWGSSTILVLIRAGFVVPLQNRRPAAIGRGDLPFFHRRMVLRDDSDDLDMGTLSSLSQHTTTPLTTTTTRKGLVQAEDSLETQQNDGSGDNMAKPSGNEYSFFDEAILFVRAGSGGQGSSTYKKVGKNGQNGPPDGGNGGQGGSVLIRVDPSLNTLAGLSHAYRPNSMGGSGATSMANSANRPKSFRAENGADGGRQFKNGRYGKDTEIRVPPGTLIQEIRLENGTAFDEASVTEDQLIDMGSLTGEDDFLLIAKGGQGGEGSGVQGKNRGGMKRPRVSATGGERKWIKLTLKVVADVALVGVPNAGKSTFLAAVTRAKPKIANYKFTTIVPNLGVFIPQSQMMDTDKGAGSEGLVLCDVPGLIEGAAEGVGLGHAFLRHVERCHVILHLIDATADDPIHDFDMLNAELVKYGTGQLAKMPQVVVVNKMDVYSSPDVERPTYRPKYSKEELEARLLDIMPHTRLLWMSAKEKEGVEDLMVRLQAFVKKVKESA